MTDIYITADILLQMYYHRYIMANISRPLIIYSLRSWISTPALHKKLRIGQTSTVAYNVALEMGLDPKLNAGDPSMWLKMFCD